jgi:small subunit ribosomal protein S17
MPKRVLEGVVVSDKGDKTVVVRVERTFLHPVLKKTVRRSKKYHAHDEANAFKTGEHVRIVECAPHSKLKTWEVLAREAAQEAGAPKAKASRAKKAAPAEEASA